MDAVALRQQLDSLATENLRRADGEARDDLLDASVRLEAEARRINVPDFVAVSLLRRADILLAVKRYGEALDALDRARLALGTLRQHDLLVSLLAKKADAYGRMKDWPRASSTCEEGITLVEAHRYKVSTQYMQSAYLRFRIGLYAWGVRAAFELDDHALMLQRMELSKCRSIVHRREQGPSAAEDSTHSEQQFRRVCAQIDAARERGAVPDELLMMRRTLWDLLLIARAAERDERSLPFDLAAVEAVLEADEAILYYYWLDTLSLMIVTIDGRTCVPELRSVSLEQRRALEAFTQSVLQFSKGNTNSFDAVQPFAEWLLPDGMSDRLAAKRRLIISPHRMLHALPFHALRRDDAYLIERYAVTYVPNLTSLLLGYDSIAARRTLAIGISDYNVPGYEGRLGSLPKAEKEVESLRDVYPHLDVFTGPDANEGRLRQLEHDGTLGRFTCLHFATHGENVNSDTPMESHLFLRDSILDGLEVANWKLRAECVVLSACCSGQRPISGRGMQELPGDELFGLQAAFFAAGAKRILSALWPVDSRAAVPITLVFHQHLSRGASPEEALRLAVIAYIRNAGTLTRKIYYWAPFFLSAMGRPTRPQPGRTTHG
jgi:CHAT domain-containing protein